MKHTNQEGAILLVSLMLLIILTLMTFTVSNTVLQQERMTIHDRDDVLALQVAEMAISDAEQQIAALVSTDFSLDGSGGLYDGDCDTSMGSCYLKEFAEENIDFFAAENWTDDNSIQAATNIDCFGGSCEQGRYKIIRKDIVDITVAGASGINVIGQTTPDGLNADVEYRLYHVIATGTGIDPNNRRVVVSHFAAAEQ